MHSSKLWHAPSARCLRTSPHLLPSCWSVHDSNRSSQRRPVCVHASVSAQTVQQDAPGMRPLPWTGSQEQEQALEQMRARFRSQAISDDVLRWYLRDRYFDVQEAEQKLRNMLAWRTRFRPDLITAEAVAREYATGKAYVHTHPDNYGRPAVIIRCKHHRAGEFPVADSQRLCVHLIDKAVTEAKAAGGEHIIGIFDLRGFQMPENADFVFVKFIIEAFFEYYPRRVSQVLFVDAPWVFQPAWAAIKPLLRKYSALVRFVSSQELKTEVFTPTTLPPDFR